MGARQSKRSVDISVASKKGAEGAGNGTGTVEERLERIEDADGMLPLAKVTQNGTAPHTDAAKPESPLVNGSGEELVTEALDVVMKEGEATEKEAAKKEEAEEALSNGVTEGTEEGASSPSATTADEKGEGAEEAATPEGKGADDKKKKKEKTKKKWSFRSISFSRKSKPSLSREGSKSPEAAVAEVAEPELAATTEAVPILEDSEKEKAVEAAVSDAAGEEKEKKTELVVELPKEAKKEVTVAVAEVTRTAEELAPSVSVSEPVPSAVVVPVVSEQEPVVTVVATSPPPVIAEVIKEAEPETLVESSHVVEAELEALIQPVVEVPPPLPDSPPPTEVPPPTPIAPSPAPVPLIMPDMHTPEEKQQDHEEAVGGGESMAELPASDSEAVLNGDADSVKEEKTQDYPPQYANGDCAGEETQCDTVKQAMDLALGIEEIADKVDVLKHLVNEISLETNEISPTCISETTVAVSGSTLNNSE